MVRRERLEAYVCPGWFVVNGWKLTYAPERSSQTKWAPGGDVFVREERRKADQERYS